MAAADPKLEELAALIGEIRERVRARHLSQAADLALPDLMPVLHARDAAQAKVASIGSVNPRPPGLVNALIQFTKRLTARALDWHVRDQVEFNRSVLSAIESLLGVLEENNRVLRELASRTAAMDPLAEQLRDTQSHWITWRQEWERKLAVNETQFLRSLADLQTAFQHRATLMESNFRDLVRSQHSEFTTALERATLDIQQRLWADLERIRLEYESVIHNELRLVRQRAALLAPAAAAPHPAQPDSAPLFDYLKFADKFRGPESYVRDGQRRYADSFAGCREVLDLGCGRGEFLELMREAGIPARGIELSAELVAFCRRKGLAVHEADLFDYLSALADQSVDGIFSAQVVEHLPPARLPDLIRLCHAKLRPEGLLVIETPNPECLAIFATHFYLDPTHTRPIPPPLLAFYFEEFGFGRIEIRRFSPALDSMPSLASLPPDFREAFFADLDYAVLGRRLS